MSGHTGGTNGIKFFFTGNCKVNGGSEPYKKMRRLLVIDDEENMLYSLNKYFTTNGFHVATLSRGEAAFNLISEFKPDIILLDIKLMDVDGRDICLELKAGNRTKRIKIILCSGQVFDKKEYMDYGADDFIAKPFQLTDLLQKI